ncbi:uncharacterized protein [Spinacia oleracea]|uniref:RNase H type-1 domain-containing protein n=1 Tax=Spinacia oleracea TaxID=3562 RepID=A0ABM3QWT5_SPIOL|nr:uncharacterized protein LOC130462879 [Spinacia oleracea]
MNVSKGLWRNLVPHRIEVFVWLALLGKVNSKEKLARIGIIPQSENYCVLCNEATESCDHLFIHCHFSRGLWNWWIGLWGLCWVSPSSTYEAFKQWSGPTHGKFLNKIWTAIFFIIIWTIWRERNSRCFENKSSSIAQLQTLILLRLSWWINGWGDSFPYNSDDIIRNPHCLRWDERLSKGTPRTLPKIPNTWSPPSSTTLKWNVDASLNPIEKRSSIGGVLRDCHGTFMCLFSSPIPPVEINHAEVLAIHRAIKIFMAHEHLHQYKLVVKSDSDNAVKWCSNLKPGPWNLTFILNYIDMARKKGMGIDITYKGRESNTVADALARQGLRRQDEFVAWL